MWIFGLLLIAAGVGCGFGYISSKRRAAAMQATETATVEHLEELARSMSEGVGAGALNYATEVKGRVVCDQPLVSELTGTECVYYSMRVQRRYEEVYYTQDDEGNRRRRTRTGTESVAGNQRSVPFMVDDGTGRIRVVPGTAEMVADRVLSRFESAEGRSGGALTVGSYTLRMPAGGREGDRRTLGFQFEEEAVAVGRNVYVLGEATDRDGSLAVQAPHAEGRFIVSVKGEDELLRSSRSSATGLLVGGVVCVLAGLAAVVYGLMAGAAGP